MAVGKPSEKWVLPHVVPTRFGVLEFPKHTIAS